MRSWQAHPSHVESLAFRPDGAVLASCARSDGHVRLWCPATGAALGAVGLKRRERPADWQPTALAYSADSAWLAVGLVHVVRGAPSIRVWSTADPPRLAAEHSAPPPAVGGLAFTPAARPTLFAADWTRLLAYRDAAEPDGGNDPSEPVRLSRDPDRRTPNASRVAASPCGRWVASTGRTKAVVWDAATLKPVAARPHPTKSPHNGPAAFDPAGARLAVAHGTKVDVWPFPAPAAPAVELRGHRRPVWGVGFSPDGAAVRTASSDGTVRAWDAATGALRQTYDWGLGKLYAAAFAPDGLVGAAGTADGRVVLWDVE